MRSQVLRLKPRAMLRLKTITKEPTPSTLQLWISLKWISSRCLTLSMVSNSPRRKHPVLIQSKARNATWLIAFFISRSSSSSNLQQWKLSRTVDRLLSLLNKKQLQFKKRAITLRPTEIKKMASLIEMIPRLQYCPFIIVQLSLSSWPPPPTPSLKVIHQRLHWQYLFRKIRSISWKSKLSSQRKCWSKPVAYRLR